MHISETLIESKNKLYNNYPYILIYMYLEHFILAY